MKSLVHLAWRYVAHNRAKTLILVFSITLIVYVPVGLRVLIDRSAEELIVRAERTPLVVGEGGSPLELTLSSLYFEGGSPGTIAYSELARVQGSGLASAVPLNVRFHSRGRPIVGTSLEYFEHRGLEIEDGRQLARVGECVVGAEVARRGGLGPGDTLLSSPETAFDLAGVYPLRMEIAGVLAPAHTPDDEAVFVDVKTAWIIEGIGHGHDDLERTERSSAVLDREGNRITANASVVQFNEITDENADSFHFHGDSAGFPLTSVLVFPHDAKGAALLRGRYQSTEEPLQMVRPVEVVESLLETVFRVQGYVVAALMLVGASTLATSVLVFLLSLRLRRREIETFLKLGAPRRRVVAVLSMEVAFVVAASLALAGILTALTQRYGAPWVRALWL